MSRKIFLIFFLILIVSLVILFNSRKIEEERKESQVCFKKYCFFVELALTKEEKMTGLMFREILAKDKGMLFIYEKEGDYSFWMKNVLIPLDIIWIDQDQKVVHVAEKQSPCLENFCASIISDKPARYVLEINGGMVSEIGLSVGDRLDFKIKEKNR